MAEMKKLFVRVPSTATFDGAVVSAADNTKIYFDEKNSKIWNNGIAYGVNTSDLWQLAETEKILGLDGRTLSSTLSISIEKKTVGEAEVDAIVLKGKDGAEVDFCDASAFVKDGMISSVAWSTEEGKETVLVITWNTDAGKTATEIDMSTIIKAYEVKEGSEDYLGIENYKIETKVVALEDAHEASEGVEKSTGLADALDVKTYVDTEVAAAKTYTDDAIDALDATVSSNADAFAEGATESEYVAVKVTEEDGKITAVNVEFDPWAVYESPEEPATDMSIQSDDLNITDDSTVIDNVGSYKMSSNKDNVEWSMTQN